MESKVKGTGEMLQWLRAPAALPENLDLIPSIQVNQNHLYQQFRVINSFFWALRVIDVVQAYSHTHK